jgi:hypothetical protein
MKMSNNSFMGFQQINSSGQAIGDRDLDAQELEAETKAEKLRIQSWKRITPIPGRIGFLLRNLHKDVGMRNEMVISFLELIEDRNQRKFIKNLLIWWGTLDEYSRRRVDLFDLFCERYGFGRAKLWATIQEGMFVSNDALTKTALDGYRPKLVELLIKMANKERNSGDRKLLAEAVGLIGGDTTQVKIEDNRQIVNNNLNVVESSSPIPSFADSIRRADKNVRKSEYELEEIIAPRELTDGNSNYLVDGFIVETEEERELVLSQRKE